MLKFITSNKNKFREIKELLKPIKVQQLNIELDEIQEIDPKKIIEHKLKEAFKHHKGPFIIEDSSFALEAMGGKLPGPFVKYFSIYLGSKNLAKLAIASKKQKAVGSVIIAYAKNLKEFVFFSGKVKGKVVLPRGKHGFGYDPIFMPNGSNKTLGEMKKSNNFSKSPRALSVKKLKNYLLKQTNEAR